MQKSLLGGELETTEIETKIEIPEVIQPKYEPFYHDLYNDLFYKDIIFPGKRNGYFVEVGALNGLVMSQSYLFEKTLDWNGIVVEPNPFWHEDLDVYRECGISKEAISDKKGNAVFECREIPSFSGLKSSINGARISDVLDEFEVETITLCDLFDKFNAPEEIDWVSIDTEGAEIDILKQYFLENTKYKINLLSFESLYQNESDELLKNQPYLEIKNPYLDFLKITHDGLMKFNPFTGELFKSPFKEFVYKTDFIEEPIFDVNFEKYYIHLDYLKENPRLKKLLI